MRISQAISNLEICVLRLLIHQMAALEILVMDHVLHQNHALHLLDPGLVPGVPEI